MKMYSCKFIFTLLFFAAVLEKIPVVKCIQGRFSRDIKNYEIVYPVKVSASGRFVSHNLRHFFPSVSSRHRRNAQNNTVHYKIVIDRDEKHVTLQPNFDLVAPGSVVEYRRARSLDGLPDVDFKPVSENHCHFHGHIDGEAGSKATISTCNGLAGYLIFGQQLYLIEPTTQDNVPHNGLQPHLLYRSDYIEDVNNLLKSRQSPDKELFCGTKASRWHPSLQIEKAQDSTLLNHNIHVKESKEYFLEILVVADKTMIDYHKNMDLEQYILTIFNMAYNMYHDASLGAHINLVLVRIIRLEEGETEMNNAVVASDTQTLESFCAWADKQNPEEESHPNHHDVAVLLTRMNLKSDEGSDTSLGLAYTGGACKRKYQCNVDEDSGLSLGFTVAHEIGHNLGMDHDTEEDTGCLAKLPDGSVTVMSPFVSMAITHWSSCSREALIKFLDAEKGTCMEDKPKAHKFQIADILPGVMYGGDYQCQQMYDLYDPTSKQCSIDCEDLVCEGANSECSSSGKIPAPGTPCGENKWCYHHKCLTVGERPGAVDGEWGSWSEWSQCSRECGIALANSTRACDNPSPAHGGQYCLGERKRYKMCDHKPCPKGYSFREEQCSAFNGGGLIWTPLYHDTVDMCSLLCINNKYEHDIKKTQVPDGTECIRSIRDVCIGGVCKTIPCDNDLMSDAVEDACGVCRGDGTSCTVERGSKAFSKHNGVLQKLIDIPVGATNVQVEEDSPNLSQIFLMYKHRPVTKGVPGLPSGEFVIGDTGMTGWMGMLKNMQELLYIKGPTTEPLFVSVNALDDVTVSYSMGVKAETKRHTHFHWDFTVWTKCSADCGVGTQVSRPQCVEKHAGLVDSSYCKDIDKPDPQMKTCELKPCTL